MTHIPHSLQTTLKRGPVFWGTPPMALAAHAGLIRALQLAGDIGPRNASEKGTKSVANTLDAVGAQVVQLPARGRRQDRPAPPLCRVVSGP